MFNTGRAMPVYSNSNPGSGSGVDALCAADAWAGAASC